MKLKYMIVGFIAGVFATIALTAGASTVYEKFTAVARPDYKLVVDGEAAKLNNAPVTINGSSYLPVREVATLLDKNVSFNSGTININSKEGDNVSNNVSVTDYLTLRQIGEQYNISIVVGDDVTIGELSFPRPSGKPDRIEVINTELGDFHIKIQNGIFFLSESELKQAGIV